MKLYILSDRRNPGRFDLATEIREVDDYVEADILPWREARRRIDPDTFSYACRTSFRLWCEARGL